MRKERKEQQEIQEKGNVCSEKGFRADLHYLE